MTEQYMKFSEQQKNAAENLGLKAIGMLKDPDTYRCVPNKRLCIGMECLDRELWDLMPAIPEMKKLGIGRARLQSGWAKTEKERGVYDFEWLDKEVDALLEAGIEPWLSLSYGNPVYDTTHQSQREFGLGHVPMNSPEEKEGWLAYTRATVQHFHGRISIYEIWNEPDVIAFFPYGDRWKEIYQEMVVITSQAIREADPEAVVVGCIGNAAKFLGMLPQGIGQYLDVLSFHNYRAWPEVFGTQTRNLVRTMRDQYAPHLKLWRGEAGCPSYNPPTSRGALYDMKTSEIVQAKWLLRHLLLDLGDPMIELTSYFHAFEFEHYSHQHHYYYGILRYPDYSRKPGYEALQLLTHIVDEGTVPVQDISCMPAAVPEGKRSNQVLNGSCVQSFRRKGAPLCFYWYPEVLQDDSEYDLCEITHAFLPDQWQNAVLIDPFTRIVYEADLKHMPITDYPLILAEPEAVADLVDPQTPLVYKKEETVDHQKFEE